MVSFVGEGRSTVSFAEEDGEGGSHGRQRGYPNSLGFLAPYRGVRYHRNERRGHAPANAKELFNYRHSSLKNIIERSFGLIKKRWAILRTEPFFDIKVQVKIVIACCTLHNFILNVDPDDLLDMSLMMQVRI
ncbi:hypothetical protein L1049_011241 [Liquidambar formosana]|uniref:DDE Tnp4 domain-containing protein n=1 Tax=Liquidambar formosana TaxID=63359 RepID=A0AAP0WWW4_LIQFO